jgi:hypothetical protein
MKDLRDAVRDEHDMHRAKSIANFRSFNVILRWGPSCCELVSRSFF